MPMSEIEPLGPADVRRAMDRIGGMLHRTPLLESSLLNRWIGHRVVFKAENLQKVGAFKARGAANTLLFLKESGEVPGEVVAHSSGNHAQAAAWACAEVGVPLTVFMPETASAIKQQATRYYGAAVELAPTRREAVRLTAERVERGAFLLHPYDLDGIIAGQGTACLEALEDGPVPEAIFTPCGGGGLLSGTVLAAEGSAPDAVVHGVEPVSANDAARSYRTGRIHEFPEAPETIADGVQTLSVSERTFLYIRRTAGILEVGEPEIVYWTQWLTHLLKSTVEPTAVLGMAGAMRWLRRKPEGRTVLVILSGGNLSAATRARVWESDFLHQVPGKP
jgi:threonine dehydratase